MAFTAFAPGVALAGEKEAKNVAIGATVLSAYLLSKRKTRTAGYVGAAGSVYLWKKYADSRKARRKRELAREAYYSRAAANNARAARYYRSKYHQTRSARSYRSSRYARR
jgi:hypothetical protein